jgi:hypothetical protein
MKQFFSVVLAGVALCAYCAAQDPPATQPGGAPTQSQESPAPPTQVQTGSATSQAAQTAPGPASATPRIAPGSVIPVQLTKTVDAKKAKTGDPVEARVTQDMKNMKGETLLAKDTKIVGHVIEDQPRTKEQKESHIAIAFDHVIAKSGDSPLPMSIQAIINPSALGGANSSGNGNSASSESSPSAPSSGTMAPGGAAGRSPGMGAGTPQTAPSPSTGSESANNTQTAANSHQPITGNTQGVVGISDLKLSATANAGQASVVSSDKNNVKLESGTFMLLRVSQ